MFYSKISKLFFSSWRHFGNKCSKCGRHIQASDWVRRAREHVYHLACFACNTCKRQLSTGEEFALQSSHVLCKTHFIDPNETNEGKDGRIITKYRQLNDMIMWSFRFETRQSETSSNNIYRRTITNSSS